MENAAYTRPELLAEPDWLWQHREDPNVRVIDTGAPAAYERAHIPGAVALGPNGFLKRDDGVLVLPADDFSELMQALGVSAGTTVVAYSDSDSPNAARLWWTLAYYGHTNAKVLNGGWSRWLTEGWPVTIDRPAVQRGNFEARPNGSLLCTLDELQVALGREDAQVLDVRSKGEWLGTNSRGNARVGHVPGAAHLEWTRTLSDDASKRVRPAAELRAMLAEAGIEPGREVITYCQGGIRAAHMAFVLALLGYDRVRNYDGSMREWANRDDTPLVVEQA
ncbi:MAG TPA: sulfurtransferase [Dehalococcoidia bacterium]|nr:sulfurtransferase [Dehalococcoidia bacterium]